MGDSLHEKRIGVRKRRREDVFIELTLLNTDGDYIDKVVECETVDVSVNGLKLYVSHDIPVGTVMDVCVKVEGINQPFYLTTELKWIEPLADEGWYFVGLEVYEGDDTDCALWLAWASSVK